MLFEKFETPMDLYSYKLGSALEMETTVLKMLDKLAEETHSDQLEQQFRHHADETRQQISNIERAFAALGLESDDKPCPVIEAIDKEGRAEIKRAGDRFVDAVILAGAGATEHYEISVYEWLISEAEAMGRSDVADLLRQNLEQEQHTLEEVRAATKLVAQQTAA